MMEIVSRAEAKERGLKRYFTGCSCPNGHLAERFVSTRACVDCVKDKKTKLYSSTKGKKLAAAIRATPENRAKIAQKNAREDVKIKKLEYSSSARGKMLKREWYESKRNHLSQDRDLDAYLASMDIE